jgi:hypothetical protein
MTNCEPLLFISVANVDLSEFERASGTAKLPYFVTPRPKLYNLSLVLDCSLNLFCYEFRTSSPGSLNLLTILKGLERTIRQSGVFFLRFPNNSVAPPFLPQNLKEKCWERFSAVSTATLSPNGLESWLQALRPHEPLTRVRSGLTVRMAG